MKRKYIALELGGTYIRRAIVNMDYSVSEYLKISTDVLKKAKNKSKCIVDLLLPYIEMVGKENIIAITMSLSSLMDKNCAFVYSSPMVDNFDNIDLKREVNQYLRLPVILEKDVNALLLYETERLHLEKKGIIAGIFLGTGLGNVFSIDGKIYRGFTGAASELGHIPIPDFDEECGCGKKGCIELKASGRVLQEISSKLRCDIEDIFTLYENDPAVRSVIRHFAYAIAAEISILDPRCVVLGGGIVSIPNFPLAQLIDMIKKNIRNPYPRNSLNVIKASNDDVAGVVGAAINAEQHGYV